MCLLLCGEITNFTVYFLAHFWVISFVSISPGISLLNIVDLWYPSAIYITSW